MPTAVSQVIRDSLGAALEVAARVGGQAGAELAEAAKGAFINGMDLGLLTGACVAIGACVIALVVLPRRRSPARPTPGGQRDHSAAGRRS